MRNFSKILFFFLFLLPSIALSQATITIEVNWPNWSSENRVIFRNPSNVQIGSSICNPSTCFDGSDNNSYDNIGSLASYSGIGYGTGYSLLLQDTWGDGWNGGGSYVRVYQDGILILNTDLTGGSSSTVTFDITAPLPALVIDDISVNEDDGTATFTVTHANASASGAFTVNYQTVAGSATAGNDYTSIVGGTLNFNGTLGDTESITVFITDDTIFESSETYSIQFTSTSDVSVDISDVATATIVDNEAVLGNTPLSLFEGFDGYIDYTSTGGSLRTQSNSSNSCAVGNSSSNTLSSPIPASATIEKAILYWAHSGATMDTQVTFEGTTVTAEIVYRTTLGSRIFHGSYADITPLLLSIANPSANVYNFSGLTIDTSSSYCDSATVLGGWALMIFYSDASLPASTINLYQGFDGNSNSSSSFSLSGFYAIGSTGSKTTALSWEGDQTLANNESLQFTTPLAGTNNLVGDGDNNGTTVNNPFNSTNFDNTILPIVNNTGTYGIDLDTYDVSAFILAGETSAATQINVGQDFVIMNAVVLKVPSNLITGRVFEDVNYGGGVGRNYATASGVGVINATIELYDNLGALVDTKTTDINGIYVFAGMANGSYSIRVVNNTVKSSRVGGLACGNCLPIQTFKTDYTASTLVPDINTVGGEDPSGTDSAVGTLAGAQTIASLTISSEGVVGMDFGFSFNTIVNTNEDGQGSLEQFIVNANNLDETGLDIVANSIFDPAAGEDTSIFMIPSTADPLGRTADSNFASGFFNIAISNGNPLTAITDANTKIDGRTQTAYSGNTNTGSVGSGGAVVGTSASILPVYELPEIQIYRNNGDVLKIQAANTVIRNVSIYANNNAGIRIDSGSATVLANLLGVNALGAASGSIDSGFEITGGTALVDDNYISKNTNSGILINGGTSTIVQNNHITDNGFSACFDNIKIQNGSGIIIRQNLIVNAAALGIDADNISGSVTITENTITASGQNGGTCSGNIENAGIRLDGNNSSITNNIIFSNGGAGIVLAGGNTSGNLISRNSIFANGTSSAALGIDLDLSDSLGDGVTLNDLADADNGPNGAANFPVISSSYATGTNLVVEGWSRPGAIIELFLTDINEGTATAGDNQLGMSTDYGEGQSYLATFVEGSGSDAYSGFSVYTDADGNTDTTNKFKFSITLPPGVVKGNLITATATISNTTSEFSPLSIVKIYTMITNRKITYRVNKN